MTTEKQKIWNVPNVLTMIRALLIPVYWVLFMNGHRYIALAVFIVASITDLLDGYIARKYHLITDFGKLMDPLADKLMVLSVMLSLAIKQFVPWAPLIILLAKEGLMVLGGALMLKKGIVVYAEKIGKYAQLTVVTSLLLSFFAQDWFHTFPLHLIVLWCAVAMTLCALVFYGKSAFKKWKAADQK
ncbi:MAG: CDP-diacylglycerol--glycerol-3-phosphate 3-phosphatidyltransferase [Clostridiales bacterium]|nr:CDP-diacylglycerol--glycerol-3-phosphate 3-phosphatidyltransferase [Clostridiales bacterium]